MQDEAHVNSPSPPVNPGTPPPPPGANATNGNAASVSQWPALHLEAGDLDSYISINDSIHTFEWIVLKFYASGNTVASRTAHAKRIADEIRQLKAGLAINGCPDGYVEVNGHCIRNPNS
jgi:hypothetical protein